MAFKPTNTQPAGTPQELEVERYSDFPLVRINFILIIISAAVTIAGFLLMLGPGSTADTFNPDIFSTRRIVVGPTIAFIGFIMMGIAIMWPSKRLGADTDKKSEE